MLKKLIEESRMKKGIEVNNADFLKAVCGDRFPIGKYPARMICGIVHGCFENRVKAVGISGITINNLADIPSTLDANNYFCISSFLPSEMNSFTDMENHTRSTANWRRKSEFFHQMKCVSLDDIGTKISPNLVTLPPSAMIETSPGNYQVHYILTGDDSYSRSKCERMINGLADAGLTDGGAKGVNRFMRLPVGSNTKKHLTEKNGAYFQTKLIYWEPNNTYEIDELVSHYNLNLKPLNNRRAKAVAIGNTLKQDVYQYWENLLLKLEAEKLIADRNTTSDWVKIECPWSENHTDKFAIIAGVAAPSIHNGWIGAFHCFHKSCRGKGLKDLFAFIGQGGIDVCK
jgi:hypothetical protein